MQNYIQNACYSVITLIFGLKWPKGGIFLPVLTSAELFFQCGKVQTIGFF